MSQSCSLPAAWLPNSRLEIAYLPVERLKAQTRNPRTHPKAQIKALKASISAFGFNVPVLIDAEDVTIAGHALAEAARGLGMAQVPTICLAHLSPTQPHLKRGTICNPGNLAIFRWRWLWCRCLLPRGLPIMNLSTVNVWQRHDGTASSGSEEKLCGQMNNKRGTR